jgi:hypothetical protein
MRDDTNVGSGLPMPRRRTFAAAIQASVGRLPANPFTTRQTRPGRLPPLDVAGRLLDVAGLLADIGRRGAVGIEGPHGTGKSTLLAALAAEAAAGGRQASVWRLDRRRDARRVARALLWAPAGSVVCLDGWEAIGGLGRWMIRFVARRRGVALVVTSHRPTRLPLVIRTAGSLPLLEAIVERLPSAGGLIDRADLAAACHTRAGNLREALLDLYDRFEARARQQGS